MWWSGTCAISPSPVGGYGRSSCQLLVYQCKALFYWDAGEEGTDIKRDKVLIFVYSDLGSFVYEVRTVLEVARCFSYHRGHISATHLAVPYMIEPRQATMGLIGQGGLCTFGKPTFILINFLDLNIVFTFYYLKCNSSMYMYYINGV